MQKKRYTTKKTGGSSFQRNRFTRKKERSFHGEDEFGQTTSKQVGIYKESKGDYGFVDIDLPDGTKKGYYVHFRNKRDAMDGDEVRFSTKFYHGKEEAEIEKVLKRANRIIVGELQISPKMFGFVIPRNPSIKNDIFVHPKNFLGAKNGQIVGVEIVQWSGKNPEGKVVQVLGNQGDKGIDVFALALESGAKITFPTEVIEEAKRVSILTPTPLEEKGDGLNGRKDLRNLFTVTIDGEDAKDLDDAISIELADHGNTKLYVHIADVTHYVKEKSHLDKEALERGTSIYLTDRVIPMLPEELSNGVCSLNTKADKLTLTCEMDIDKEGKIVKTEVYESVIKSNYRLTYNIVESIKNNHFKPSESEVDLSGFEKRNPEQLDILPGLMQAQKDELLLEKLKVAFDLKKRIETHRKKNGYLSFNFDESKAIVDENGDIIDIKKRDKLEAHKLIEHFMICANESVGKKFAQIPFLYRVHPDPIPEDVEKAMTVIAAFLAGDTGAPKQKFESISVEKAIEMVAGNNFLSRLILRSLTKAIYSEKNEGHFGLGLDFYSHFTSPIRRYPDLQIHRIIKEKISGRFDGGRIGHYKEILPKVAKQCSEREQRSEDLERKVSDLAKVKYMSSKIGQVFDGRISGMIPKGFFVELENTVEGFVDIIKLGKGNFTFLEDIMQLKNFVTGEVFRFGDPVKIRVSDVDTRLRRIDFELLED